MLENIFVRNRKKHSHNTVSLTISDLQLKQITIEEDHIINTYSLFCLAVLAAKNSRKLFDRFSYFMSLLFVIFTFLPFLIDLVVYSFYTFRLNVSP